MEWIKNLKIAQKLNVLLILASIISLAIGLTGYLLVQKGANDMTTMYKDRTLPIEWLGKAIYLQEKNLVNLIMIMENPREQKKHLEDMNDIRKTNDELFSLYRNTVSSKLEEKKLEELDATVSIFRTQRQKVLDAINKQNKDVIFIEFEKFKKLHDQRIDILKEINEFNIKTADEINTQNDKYAQTANIILLLTIFGGLGLLISLGLMVSAMITNPIKQAIDGLNIGTEEVSSASSQVSAASQALAEGASEQAAAIQETSATLEETSSMVHQNRENTQQAAALAKQAKQYAEKSNDEMHKMSQSMLELKNSSNEIAKIIKVIDEIAFQTNILSLNAAVEAARAGDAGKGFAVVAEEVRNLAQRSAQAAKDTTVIIESNIDLSDSSVNIAKAVRESVESIGEQAAKVSDLLEEISVATNEQAQGVEQIHKAVSQMEMALQSTATTADESASASRSLSEQASNVQEIVDTLVVLVDGAEALKKQLKRPVVLSSARPSKQISTVKHQKTVKPVTKKQDAESIIPLNDF